MEEKLKELEKRIEDLEKRPIFYPTYQPIIFPQPYYLPPQINRCSRCGGEIHGIHVC